jgi:hypothetical protein
MIHRFGAHLSPSFSFTQPSPFSTLIARFGSPPSKPEHLPSLLIIDAHCPPMPLPFTEPSTFVTYYVRFGAHLCTLAAPFTEPSPFSFFFDPIFFLLIRKKHRRFS